MKKLFAVLFVALFSFLGLVRADVKSKNQGEKFYGIISSVDTSAKSFIVHNKKKNSDLEFKWSESTEFTKNKQPVTSSELKSGEFLMVSYSSEGNINKAIKIALRSMPFKKKQ